MKRAEQKRPIVRASEWPAGLVSPESSRTESAGEAAPSHEEIARRAYEIYAESGCEQGRCLQNWLRAERELRRRGAREAVSSRAMRPRAAAGGHSELLNGDRPYVDARLIRDVMGAAADRETAGRSGLPVPRSTRGEGDRRVVKPLAGAEPAAKSGGGSIHGTTTPV